MALKDNKIFRWIIIPICIALCFGGLFLPELKDGALYFGCLTKDAVQVIGIFLGSLTLWLTIGIDWPSLLCIFALGFVDKFVGSSGFGGVLTKSFGDKTFIFLLFTFICTYALSKTSLIKRITLWFVNTKLARINGLTFSFLFLASVLIIGLFISPSVLFVVILPILEEIFKIAKIEKGEKVGKALLMGLGFTVSISSGMTLIAHVFPNLAIGLLSANDAANITNLTYSLFAIPTGLIIFLLMFIMLFIIYKPDLSKLNGIDTSELKAQLPKVNKVDIITLIVFLVVIILWIIPDFISADIKANNPWISKVFIPAMPPILGTLVLCIARVDKKPILKIDEGFKNVPWNSLVMCAATIALGAALSHNDVGIKTFLSTSLNSSLKELGGFALLLIFVCWAAIQTNLSSNMVTATLVSTVAIAVLSEITSGLNLPAVVCIIGFLASLAFATPPSMPHIAIVAGSEYCKTKDVLIFGSILMVISIVVSMAVGYPLASLLF